jgi:hypothetical protein
VGHPPPRRQVGDPGGVGEGHRRGQAGEEAEAGPARRGGGGQEGAGGHGEDHRRVGEGEGHGRGHPVAAAEAAPHRRQVAHHGRRPRPEGHRHPGPHRLVREGAHGARVLGAGGGRLGHVPGHGGDEEGGQARGDRRRGGVVGPPPAAQQGPVRDGPDEVPEQGGGAGDHADGGGAPGHPAHEVAHERQAEDHHAGRR